MTKLKKLEQVARKTTHSLDPKPKETKKSAKEMWQKSWPKKSAKKKVTNRDGLIVR